MFVAILQRAGALLLVNVLLQLALRFTDGGPTIGIGLAWFALSLAISAGWGYRDGRGTMTIRDVVILWSVVAVVVALGAALLAQLFADGIDLGVLVADIGTTMPLAVFIVLLPATIGGLIGDRG